MIDAGNDPFVQRIQAMAADNGWSLEDAEEGFAMLSFPFSSGHKQMIFISDYDDMIEFEVSSSRLPVTQLEQIPAEFAIALLQMNAQSKLGFWCIDGTEAPYRISLMYNADARHLSAGRFGEIVRSLATNVEDLEEQLLPSE